MADINMGATNNDGVFCVIQDLLKSPTGFGIICAALKETLNSALKNNNVVDIKVNVLLNFQDKQIIIPIPDVGNKYDIKTICEKGMADIYKYLDGVEVKFMSVENM